MPESESDLAAQGAYHEALKHIEICRRDRQTFLNLRGLGLKCLPAKIGELAHLTELNLSSNRLTSLPAEIGQLADLKSLDLFSNQLGTLPTEIGQLTNLTKLYLSDNRLSKLPAEIGQLINLEVLFLYSNQLSNLPAEISQLAKLTELHLSDNRLTSLPVEIGQLACLTELHLSRNQLINLPAGIGHLSRLELLTLESNGLSELPKSLRGLAGLEELTLHRNSDLGIPSELLGPTYNQSGPGNPPAKPREILDYYFASLGNQGEALREMKVLVVGRGGAGKTSVIRRLKGLPLDTQQSETHGIAIEELHLPCGDGSVAARVWDFGGQHVLHAMHEFFFTGRSLYILVLGEREDMAERDAEYWLQLIRGYAGAAPVIVVLNKSGGRARELDLPRRKLEDTYGPILAWVPTECSEPSREKGGIASLEQELTSAVGGMPEVRARFPKKWVQIKDWLSNMKESYLAYTTYAARCAELGETDPAKQEELAAFLHDLGVALNYRRDPRLHETTVLRPDWLADGIYALLRANDTRHPHPLAPDGRIVLSRIPDIYAGAEKLKMLKASDYPAAKHSFLLRLMAAFQLSFPLDEKGEEHLVPALLPVEAPVESSSSLLANPEVELRWEFPVVPGPLLPRLLVRTFGLVLEDCLWRRGAIYAYGPAIAKIWEDKERYIYLRAASRSDAPAHEEVDDLVRMIRSTLREIVAEYKNLTVQEQVRWQGDWLPRRAAESLGLCEPDEDEDTMQTEELQ